MLASLGAAMLCTGAIQRIVPSDDRIWYEGRWAQAGGQATAEWPCASISFGVSVNPGGGSLELDWAGVRVLLNVTITDSSGQLHSSCLVEAPSVQIPGWQTTQLAFHGTESATSYTVRFRRLTPGMPFGMGAGRILAPSWLAFHGISRLEGVALTATPPAPQRRLEFIGASDTAGYCVRGDPAVGAVAAALDVYYGDCDLAYPGRLASAFGAELAIEAMAGVGLTQNAPGVGPLTMPSLWPRTLQSSPAPRWPFGWAPQLVFISLGGNDYNHQGGDVPSNASFTAAYGDFLRQVLEVYPDATVLAVCGMGDPTEAEYDPDNNRCAPCPHVQAAVEAFVAASSAYAARVRYVLIPCDGSVVSGEGEMGCAGHKNAVGQGAIAAFLQPIVTEVSGWSLASP